MRRHTQASLVPLTAVILLAVGCSSTTPTREPSPIQIRDAYEGDHANIVVDRATSPEPTLELTRDGLTVRVQYVPQSELDRRHTRGDSLSAFHFESSWGWKRRVDVFQISVSHTHAKAVLLDVPKPGYSKVHAGGSRGTRASRGRVH